MKKMLFAICIFSQSLFSMQPIRQVMRLARIASYNHVKRLIDNTPFIDKDNYRTIIQTILYSNADGRPVAIDLNGCMLRSDLSSARIYFKTSPHNDFYGYAFDRLEGDCDNNFTTADGVTVHIKASICLDVVFNTSRYCNDRPIESFHDSRLNGIQSVITRFLHEKLKDRISKIPYAQLPTVVEEVSKISSQNLPRTEDVSSIAGHKIDLYLVPLNNINFKLSIDNLKTADNIPVEFDVYIKATPLQENTYELNVKEKLERLLQEKLQAFVGRINLNEQLISKTELNNFVRISLTEAITDLGIQPTNINVIDKGFHYYDDSERDYWQSHNGYLAPGLYLGYSNGSTKRDLRLGVAATLKNILAGRSIEDEKVREELNKTLLEKYKLYVTKVDRDKEGINISIRDL